LSATVVAGAAVVAAAVVGLAAVVPGAVVGAAVVAAEAAVVLAVVLVADPAEVVSLLSSLHAATTRSAATDDAANRHVNGWRG
jgi:hypothetical protein